jgi:hypothetical protein
MDWSEMVLGVARSSGIQLADRMRTGGSYPWQLDDSSHGGAMAVKGRRRKKVLHRGVLPFIGGRGGWKKVARAADGAVVAAKLWARQSGGSHSLNMVGTGGAVVRTRRLTGGPQRLWIFFQFIQNWLNFKNQNGCIILLQKFLMFA